MSTRTVEDLFLSVCPRQPARARLRAGRLDIPAAIGHGSLTRFPREGDGATPAGAFRLLEVLYRADRLCRPRTALPVRPLRPDDGWCDAPFHPAYNRPVRHPFAASAEHLWREDHIYDIIVVIDFNVTRRKQGLGSAIFFHLARPDFSPTLGCIAIAQAAMRKVLAMSTPRTRLITDPALFRRPRRS